MTLHLRLILSGLLLLAIGVGLAACAPQPEPAPLETATLAPTALPTEPQVPVLEIVGPAQGVSLTLEELLALPATKGYAGIKSSTGKITPPVMFKGIALKDLADLIGGMDESTGFSVVAEDGYSITYSYDQIFNGSFIAYDPATGQELKNPVELTAILAYEADGRPLDPDQDGTLRLAIVSADLNQVTDGHWSVKWVNRLEVKNLGLEWTLESEGAIAKTTDRASLESCGAPQCHGTSWTDDKAQVWAGVPLWLLVGAVDDAIEHEGPAFNDALAEAGYSVDVVAGDGYTVTFDAARVNRNAAIIVAYKVNDNPLPDQYFPLRLVGPDLQKNEMVGMIARIQVGLEPLPPTPEATAEPVAPSGSLTITGAVAQESSLAEADLRTLEVVQRTVEHPKKGTLTYEGVSLNALLDLAGIEDGTTTLVITASDGFSTEVSLAEVRACADCLVAFTDTAETFTMVMPGLSSSAWVKGVVRLEVK